MTSHPQATDTENELQGFLSQDEVWRGARQEKLSVSIQAKGIINLLGASWPQIGKPEYVRLLWHPQKRQIAIKAVEAGEQDAVPVRVSPGARLVTARRLLTSIGVDISTPLFFDDLQVVGDALILDLDHAHPSGPVRGRRRQLLPKD
jgi:hypothetical protein